MYGEPSTEAAMSRFLRSIFLPALFSASVAAAQTPGVLVDGQRVRVAYQCKLARPHVVDCRQNRSPRVDTGQLRTLEGDTLRMHAQSSGGELAIPTASITHLWVMDGRKGNFWAGAGIGLLGGALIGGVIGATREFCVLDCSPATGLGVIFGAPAGLVLGGIVGAMIRSDRWRAVPVNQYRVSVEPRQDAMGLRVSMAF